MILYILPVFIQRLLLHNLRQTRRFRHRKTLKNLLYSQGADAPLGDVEEGREAPDSIG